MQRSIVDKNLAQSRCNELHLATPTADAIAHLAVHVLADMADARDGGNRGVDNAGFCHAFYTGGPVVTPGRIKSTMLSAAATGVVSNDEPDTGPFPVRTRGVLGPGGEVAGDPLFLSSLYTCTRYEMFTRY